MISLKDALRADRDDDGDVCSLAHYPIPMDMIGVQACFAFAADSVSHSSAGTLMRFLRCISSPLLKFGSDSLFSRQSVGWR